MEAEKSIQVGDAVTVCFWPMHDDIQGIVIYLPQSQGDSWIIKQANGAISYVQHFASITKSPKKEDDDCPF